MGAVQSTIGTEATAAVGALVAGTTAYAVYKRVVPGVETSQTATTKDAVAGTTSTSTGSGIGGKKGKAKKKKTTTGNASAVAGGTGTGGSGGGDLNEKSDADAELDELLQRAKAERAEAEAKRAQASRGLIPGAFDNTHDLDAASSTALSNSEVEGKGKGIGGAGEGKTKKKRKKAAATAAAAGGAGTGGVATTVGASSGAQRPTNDKKEATAASSSTSTKLTEAPAEPAGGSGASKKSKKRRGAGASKAGESSAAPPPTSPSNASSSLHSSQALGVSVTLSDAPEDASWTRVSTRKKSPASSSQQQQQQQRKNQQPAGQTDAELLTSDTNLTTSGVTDPENVSEEEEDEDDEGSVRQPENRKTFAERMLPRRKTGVEDLEDEPLQPPLARVIRIKPAPGEKPAEGFSWGDYEEYANADDGTSADGDADDAWEEVKSKKRTKPDRSTSALTSSIDSLSHSAAAQTQAPSQAQTKKQRQNAKKREAAQAEKEAAERDRLERLAKHQRELEREKIKEQFKGAGSSKKAVSGGMKASVEGGKLVWD